MLKHTQFGFIWAPVEVSRAYSNPRAVTLSFKTLKHRDGVRIRADRSGEIRVFGYVFGHDEEWIPSALEEGREMEKGREITSKTCQKASRKSRKYEMEEVLEDTELGFIWDHVEVIRYSSDPRAGYTLKLKTPRYSEGINICVTRNGKIRVFGYGNEWLPKPLKGSYKI